MSPMPGEEWETVGDDWETVGEWDTVDEAKKVLPKPSTSVVDKAADYLSDLIGEIGHGAREFLRHVNPLPSMDDLRAANEARAGGAATLQQRIMDQVKGPSAFGALIEKAKSDDISGTIGAGLGDAAGMFGPGLLAGRGPTVKPKTYLNPTEATAVKWAQKRGVNVPVSDITNNKALRAVENAVEYVPLAAGELQTGRLKLQAQIRDLANTLQQEATPKTSATGARLKAVTDDPFTAGTKTVSKLTKRSEGFDAIADIHYGKLRELAANDVQMVPTGEMRPTGKMGGGGIPGSGIPEMEPVLAPMTAPVSYAAIRPEMQKFASLIRESMGSKALDDYKKANPGFAAVLDLADAPDFVPLSRALADKSAAGNIAFGKDTPAFIRSRSEGIAASLKQKIGEAIEPTLERLGPEAQSSYKKGNQAHAMKHDVVDILTKIASPGWEKEPATVFQALTRDKDASAMALESVAKTTPSVIPDLAATTLEGILKPSLATGGYTNAKSAFNKWQAIGPETKRILFPDVAADLDQFFQFTQQMQTDLNRSGSGKLMTLSALGGSVVTQIGYGNVAGAVGTAAASGATMLAGKKLAKLLYSPGGARMVMEGVKIPLGDPAAAALRLAILSQVAPITLKRDKDGRLVSE